MLEQYRQDYSAENDALSDNRFQMSKRKLVFTMAAAALALVSFLFLIGAFRSDDAEPAADGEKKQTLIARLDDLQTRVEKLEQHSQPPSLETKEALATLIDSPIVETAKDAQAIDQTLKELIASEPIAQEPPPVPVIPNTPPVPEQAKSPILRTYVVQRGDTLSKISLRFYGSTKRWKDIADANRDTVTNTNQLKVGTKLIIPEDKK